MGTRSYIGIVNEDKSIDAIYCHWDGYPSHNGEILINFYNNENAVRELIALGGLSSLEQRIAPNENEVHTFDNPIKGVTVAYHRDRGEELEIMHFTDCESMINEGIGYIEYFYVWYNGAWECYDGNKEYYELY